MKFRFVVVPGVDCYWAELQHKVGDRWQDGRIVSSAFTSQAAVRRWIEQYKTAIVEAKAVKEKP